MRTLRRSRPTIRGNGDLSRVPFSLVPFILATVILLHLWWSTGCTILVAGDSSTPENAQRCFCTCELAARDTLHTIQIGADDADEDDLGEVSLDRLQHLFVRQLVGLRFRDVPIPRGATIESAHIQFTASQTHMDDAEVAIHARRDLDPFLADTDNLSDRLPMLPPDVPQPPTAAWIIPPWNIDEAGAAQRTPDLSSLIMREVGIASQWNPGDTLVFLFEPIPDFSPINVRTAYAFDQGPDVAPVLEVSYRVAVTTNPLVSVCMPPDLNPNLDPDGDGETNPDPAPTDGVRDYCEVRVADTLLGLASQCFGAVECSCRVDSDASTRTFTHPPCDEPCVEEELDDECVEFDPVGDLTVATNAPGDEPVCLAEGNPDDPSPQPLTRGVFGRRSLCVANGTTEIEVSGHSAESFTRSFVSIVGDPCPGQSCDVGVAHVTDVEQLEIGGFLGFGSTTIDQMKAAGASAPRRATLDVAGDGMVATGDLFSAGRGRRRTEKVVGETVTEVGAYAGENPEPIALSVNWQTKECSLAGAVVSTISEGDESDELSARIDLAGFLVNQPPNAQATTEPEVECNSSEGAEVFLDGSASDDPDDNIVERVWLAGSRTGDEVGAGEMVTVQQMVGTQTYILRVFDLMGQIDEATVEVEVVDNTIPDVACNTPPTITPPDAPIVFMATADDSCDDTVVPEITDVDCWKFTKKGKRIDKTESCVVNADGSMVEIAESGGVGTHIGWTVRAQDSAGNTAETSCEIEVEGPH